MLSQSSKYFSALEELCRILSKVLHLKVWLTHSVVRNDVIDVNVALFWTGKTNTVVSVFEIYSLHKRHIALCQICIGHDSCIFAFRETPGGRNWIIFSLSDNLVSLLSFFVIHSLPKSNQLRIVRTRCSYWNVSCQGIIMVYVNRNMSSCNAWVFRYL